MIKILLISDIHAGESSESTNHPGQRRQANSTAINTLQKYIQKFNDEKFDYVVNLGDNIRNSPDRELNKKNLLDSLKIFEQIKLPKLYVTGNHEYKNMSQEDVNTILREAGASYEKSGFKQIGDLKLVWIDSVIGEKDLASVSEETVNWLGDILKPSDNVILLSHYSLCKINEPANFYFGKDPKYMSYENGAKIMKILHNCKSAITINGHTHMANHKIIEKINCFSIMAFSENITNMSLIESNPGIYSVLEIDNDTRTLKTFSGEYCIVRYEF